MLAFLPRVTASTYQERAYEARGLGRLVEPDVRMRQPRLHRWSRYAVSPDGYEVRISWVRDVTQGFHSIEVMYAPDTVGIALRLGTRPGFGEVAGLVVLNVVVEHAVVHLREPLGGRRVVAML